MDYIALGKTLQEARIALGLKQIDVANRIGCTSANISSWERGKSKIDIDSFAELCMIYNLDFGVTLERLNQNANTVNELISTIEREHIKKYRTLDEYGKELVDSVLEIEFRRCNSKNNITELTIELPMPELPASAGTGTWLEDGYNTPVTVKRTKEAERANVVIRVSGESMEPLFSDGECVLVRIQPDIETGEIGIFIVDNEGYIKKKGSGELISVNPEYDNIPIGEFTEYRCFGKVLGKAEILE